MQGQQHYQPELFSVIDIEKLIPKNHLLRKLDQVLDLSFIREITAPLYCQDNGRPSVDPELYFRMQLIIYLYNIPSERRACEEIALHLAYRWFCKLSMTDEVPDHTSLTKIRERLGEEIFKKIFDHIVRLCIEKKIAKPDSVMADGTLIKANAALNSLVEVNEGDTDDDIKAKEPPKYIVGQRYSNSTHVSQTDPDCRLAGKVGEPKQLRYKVHSIADRKGRVILDTHVTDGSVMEGKIFLKRLDYVEETYGIKIADAVADRGYGYGEILDSIEKRGITSFIPNFHSDVGEGIDYEIFKYDKEHDVFVCLAGHKLERRSSDETEAKDYARRYQIRKPLCSDCPFNVRCFPLGVRPRKKLLRNIYWEVQAKTKEREKTIEFQEVRGERQWKMEGLFAEGKSFHGLNRARHRRRHNVQIQAYMIASVQNLKRLMGALGHIFELLRSAGRIFRKKLAIAVMRKISEILELKNRSRPKTWGFSTIRSGSGVPLGKIYFLCVRK